MRLMYGAAMMFLAAAFVEAFWSPITEFGFQRQDRRRHRRAGSSLLAYFSCSPGARAMQPADIAIALRRRTPWEAMDLGLAMLQRWWRHGAMPHLVVGTLSRSPAGALSLGLASARRGRCSFVWWLKPLYDRVVLHVLSRAVFGEVQSPRQVLGARARMARHRAPWR